MTAMAHRSGGECHHRSNLARRAEPLGRDAWGAAGGADTRSGGAGASRWEPDAPCAGPPSADARSGVAGEARGGSAPGPHCPTGRPSAPGGTGSWSGSSTALCFHARPGPGPNSSGRGDNGRCGGLRPVRPPAVVSSHGVRILVVVPTYNEAANIEALLREVHAALPDAGILVVDDGSPDGTAELAEKAAVEIDDVHVLRRTEKSGLGSAYRAGFHWGLAAGYDACVEMDADFSHDPAALPGLVGPLEDGYELVVGSRYVPGGSIPNWSWSRHLLSWGGNRYADAVLGLGVRDSTAGFRAYAASVLERLDLDRIRAEGYGFQIEMTYRVKQAGAPITEVPISFVDRVAGESKMSSAIVVEAFLLVAWWGLGRLARCLTSGSLGGGMRPRRGASAIMER